MKITIDIIVIIIYTRTRSATYWGVSHVTGRNETGYRNHDAIARQTLGSATRRQSREIHRKIYFNVPKRGKIMNYAPISLRIEDIDSGNLLQVAKFALDCIIEQNIWDEEHSDTGPTLQNKNVETMLKVAISRAECL